MKDIATAVQNEVKKSGLPPIEITELNLDAKCKAPVLKGLDGFSNLKSLSLSNVGLTSLEGFPSVQKLRTLTLSDNRISGGLEHLVRAGLDSLEELDLSNNKISTVEALTPLAGLKLVSLDLYQCPVEKVSNFRGEVFKMLATLQYLNNEDIHGEERKLIDDDDFDEDEEPNDLEEEEDAEDEEGVEGEEGEEEYEEEEEVAEEEGDDEEGDAGGYEEEGDEGEGEDDEGDEEGEEYEEEEGEGEEEEGDDEEGEEDEEEEEGAGVKRKRDDEDDDEEEEEEDDE